MKQLLSIAALGAVILTGCNGSTVAPGPTPSNPPAQTYTQTELLARPAVKEAFESFANHDTTNRTEPYNDPTLQMSIGNFMTSVAGRSAATASALQSVLYPNEMTIDTSQVNGGTASYLGVETGGATGSKFGGRALSDDVIGISLGAIFGNTLSALGVVPDDTKESPCLMTDNVSYDKSNTNTFPYVQAPL
ncbi:MAG TPA: DUF4331 family protein [Candidatus Baltobacteraceae bacterium]|jgi:hypothetical protein|nr:DUF4331 family protein [Candidatus Baltobacteraceae bacterium]